MPADPLHVTPEKQYTAYLRGIQDFDAGRTRCPYGPRWGAFTPDEMELAEAWDKGQEVAREAAQ